jgi:hypothetical protein
MSFEYPRRLLPKSRLGILVKGETFTVTKEWQFAVSPFKRLLAKGYLKELPHHKKGKRKEKAKAAR